MNDLHTVIQAAFGWGGHHLHRFTTSKTDWNAEEFVMAFEIEEGDEGTPEWEVRVEDVLAGPGDRLFYWYDYGDDWWHTLTLESVEASTHAQSPASLVTGRRATPPDDCGGVHGYSMLLDAVKDPTHPEHAELTAWFEGYPWVGEASKFDPAAVDLDDLRLAVLHALD